MLFCIIFILLILLEVVYFGIAGRLGIIDRPKPRSSHRGTVLLGGGVIFLLAVWLYAAFFVPTYPWFIAGLTLVGAVSFADDVRPLPDTLRLAVQLAAMLLMFRQFGILNAENLWFVPVALTIGVGIVNAYNFMDGINGITGGYSMAVLLPMMYLNVEYGFINQEFLYTVGLSLAVFCFFNFRTHARCFAGDVGSISIAFILLFALGSLMLRTGDFSYLAFMAVYGTDATLTLCHRALLRENIRTPHRKHAYQLLANELRVPHITISLSYAAAQLIISAGLIFLPVNHYLYLGIVVALLAVAYILFVKNFHYYLR